MMAFCPYFFWWQNINFLVQNEIKLKNINISKCEKANILPIGQN